MGEWVADVMLNSVVITLCTTAASAAADCRHRTSRAWQVAYGKLLGGARNIRVRCDVGKGQPCAATIATIHAITAQPPPFRAARPALQVIGRPAVARPGTGVSDRPSVSGMNTFTTCRPAGCNPNKPNNV
jgi:hypothetical protein